MAQSPLLFASLLFSLLAAAQNTSPENGNVSPEDGGGPAAPVPTTPSAPAVNNAAGAAGSSSSFNLSTTGTIVIIVVCVVVGCLGIASAVLFYIAKKRQWEVRKSIKRASRRVASKMDPRQSRRQSRPRGMVRMASPSKGGTADLEKGEGNKAKPAPKVQDRKIEKMQVDDSATQDSKSRTSEKRWKTVMPDSWTVGGKR